MDGQKISKDHLDSVLTVDANNDLQLFCSSRYGCTVSHKKNLPLHIGEICLYQKLRVSTYLYDQALCLVDHHNRDNQL